MSGEVWSGVSNGVLANHGVVHGGRIVHEVSAPVATITHSHNGTFTGIFAGTNGSQILCDPGNGEPLQVLTLLGPGNDVYFNYVNAGVERTVRVSGDLDKVSECTFYAVSATTASGFDLLTNPSLDLRLHINSLTAVPRLPATLRRLYLQANQITNISNLVGTVVTVAARIDNNPVVYTAYTWATQTSGVFFFNSTVSTAAEVDQWLIDLNAAGWSNCTIYIDGTNPAPTAASAAAIAALAGRGCTVYTT